MRNIWTIARREYRQYFGTPMAYMVAFLYLLVLGVIFYYNLLTATYQQYPPQVQAVIGPMVTVMLFVTPAADHASNRSRTRRRYHRTALDRTRE